VLQDPVDLAGRGCKVRCELSSVVEVTHLMLKDSNKERCLFSGRASD